MGGAQVINKVICTECRYACVSQREPSDLTAAYQLIKLRNNGGLVVPSDGVVKVVACAERHLRQLSDLHSLNIKAKNLQLQARVLQELGSDDVLELGQHIFDTVEGIDHHGTSLMRRLVSSYFSLRQHHIARLHTLKLQGSSVRQSLTKTILFKGQ